jgi:peptide/nickel transport system substrate-binding protein
MTRNGMRRAAPAVWAVLAGALAMAPGGEARAQGASRPGTLRVVPSADLTVLDPMFSTIIVTRLYSLMVYETLFAWDTDLQPKPQMVESWTTTPDGLSWQFALRDGLAFHDGAAVTSQDVVASLKRWMARDALGLKLATYVTGMETEDAKRFSIRLSRPAPFLPFALGSGIGIIPAIMRASDLAGDPKGQVSTAIGSGPFRFNQAERVSGARAVFDRNRAYVPRAEPPNGLAGGRLAKVDQVEWVTIPDANTAVAALQTGEVDLLEAPLLDLVPVLQRDRAITVRKINNLNNQGILRPNALHPPFNDPRARQALALLANQDDYMSAVVADPKMWRRCASYYLCDGPWGGGATGLVPAANTERARSLLAEAGYKGEPLVVVASKELAPIGQMSEVMIDGLRRAGANLDVRWTDWGTMATRITQKAPPTEGGWNLSISYSSGITAHSPMTNVGTNMACDGRNWAGWPCDEEVEKLRQIFVDAPDQAARLAAVVPLQARLEQVRPYVPLGEFDAPIAYRSNLRGVLDSPVITYWNIEKP